MLHPGHLFLPLELLFLGHKVYNFDPIRLCNILVFQSLISLVFQLYHCLYRCEYKWYIYLVGGCLLFSILLARGRSIRERIRRTSIHFSRKICTILYTAQVNIVCWAVTVCKCKETDTIWKWNCSAYWSSVACEVDLILTTCLWLAFFGQIPTAGWCQHLSKFVRYSHFVGNPLSLLHLWSILSCHEIMITIMGLSPDDILQIPVQWQLGTLPLFQRLDISESHLLLQLWSRIIQPSLLVSKLSKI